MTHRSIIILVSKDRSRRKGLSVLMEDGVLVWRLNRGDATALARVYEKYCDDLLRLAALLPSIKAAADVVQDVFVRFAGSGWTFREIAGRDREVREERIHPDQRDEERKRSGQNTGGIRGEQYS